MKQVFSKLKKSPFIGCDIDGVLKKGKLAIPKAAESIKFIRDKNIPLLLITNAGGNLESVHASYINSILNFQNDEKYKIKDNEIILCHSPMRSLYNKYKDKLILISGIYNYEDVIKQYGFNNFITVNEYAHIFHKELLPNKRFYTNNIDKLYTEYRKRVEKRLNISLDKFPKVDCIFNMTDIRDLFESVQVRR